VRIPTPPSARRQPIVATSVASGSVESSAPSMPTVALSAARYPNRVGGNQAAAILSVPMNVAAAPSPTRKRPANSSVGPAAAPMSSAPPPMIAPPIARTILTPNASSRSPAGIISAA
jgi:hypothetical protein